MSMGAPRARVAQPMAKVSFRVAAEKCSSVPIGPQVGVVAS